MKFLAAGLELLSDILRMKDNRQPTIILKALTLDAKKGTKARSILAELRDKSEPSKKIIVAISQKSLDQFLNDVTCQRALDHRRAISSSLLSTGSTTRHCQYLLSSAHCGLGKFDACFFGTQFICCSFRMSLSSIGPISMKAESS